MGRPESEWVTREYPDLAILPTPVPEWLVVRSGAIEEKRALGGWTGTVPVLRGARVAAFTLRDGVAHEYLAGAKVRPK